MLNCARACVSVLRCACGGKMHEGKLFRKNPTRMHFRINVSTVDLQKCEVFYFSAATVFVV